MADQAITALCDIDPMLDDAKILVRVVRVWKAHPITRPNEIWSLEVLFQDQQGNRIQASIKKTDMNKFQTILDEGSCYKVGSFGVGKNGGKFPLLSHRYKIGFYKNTSVTRVDPFDQNTRGFLFEPFQKFTRRQFTETDIVGTINMLEFESQSRHVHTVIVLFLMLTSIESLIKYCKDESLKEIIYGYMAIGNLESHLFGLKYLHYGCKPPIGRRDIKGFINSTRFHTEDKKRSIKGIWWSRIIDILAAFLEACCYFDQLAKLLQH
ncbi:hypothetical protein CTI12_AA349880 [Artemisia annua]|uniref:Replication protein A 70 kDa DNA-binding subunit B/D first OB fold domain-containing protein n=1 Tax=Artemisia annua TaxID=35608 RepID=A0A2U1LNH7_ARTAN|nr:hypothetical protein CTI12_AA349880 [Artemisia annua]